MFVLLCFLESTLSQNLIIEVQIIYDPSKYPNFFSFAFRCLLLRHDLWSNMCSFLLWKYSHKNLYLCVYIVAGMDIIVPDNILKMLIHFYAS